MIVAVVMAVAVAMVVTVAPSSVLLVVVPASHLSVLCTLNAGKQYTRHHTLVEIVKSQKVWRYVLTYIS